MDPAGQSLVEARGGAIMSIGATGAPGGGNQFVITAEVTAEAEAAAVHSALKTDEDDGVAADDDAKAAEA